MSASLPFSFVLFGFTFASPSGKLTISVGHRNLAPALTWVWPITVRLPQISNLRVVLARVTSFNVGETAQNVTRPAGDVRSRFR